MATVTSTQRSPLTGIQKAAVLLLPWAFLALFAFLYATFLWPQVLHGHVLAMLVSVLAGLAFVSFSAAALTFSRDVLAGRYP